MEGAAVGGDSESKLKLGWASCKVRGCRLERLLT